MTTVSILLACLLLSVLSGLAADAYVNILVQPGMILSFWAKWLYELRDRYAKTERKQAVELGVQNPHLTERFKSDLFDELCDLQERESRADYLLKPILTCVYCVGGQMGFWLSVYYFYSYSIGCTLICAVLTSFMSVWFGGAFQAIQKKYFPYN